MDNRPARRPLATAYFALLLAQTAVAGFLFWMMVPLFPWMVAHVGEPMDIDMDVVIAIIFGAGILQCCYWTRFRWLPVYAPFHSVVVAHILLFASRASFFFGGALFSVVFFRHMPELAALPPITVFLTRIFAVFSALFALFCYSLELERLGKAIADVR